MASDRDKHGLSEPPSGLDSNAVEYYASQRKKRSLKKGILIGVICCVLAVVAVGVGVFAWAMGIQGKLQSGVSDDLVASLTDTAAVPGDAFYMLLLGVDKNADRAASAEYGADDSNYRSDSIMLARIDPKQKQVTLVSLHRDLLIDMDEHGRNKLNSAYSFGGPAYVVEVVSELAGVPISHYAEVNFDEFDSLVDALGGIEVDVPIDINDPLAGAPIKAGLQTLDGAQALTLARSRHAYDAYGDGDVFRAANQRMVIAAIAKKILASDPMTMASTISQLAEMVTTDLSLQDIISLASEMRGINMDTDVYTGMTPTSSLYMNETWYELLLKDQWKTMMTRVDQGLSPYSSAEDDQTQGLAGSTVNVKNGDGDSSQLTYDTTPLETYDATVRVLNGSSIDGLAGRIANSLASYGFVTSTGDADVPYAVSVVAYMKPEAQADAEAIAEILGGEIVVENGQGVYVTDSDSDVLVVLGSDMANSVDMQ